MKRTTSIRICCLILFSIYFCAPVSAQIKAIKAYYSKADKEAVQRGIAFIQPEMQLLASYEELQQIILIRHGEPALNKSGWFNRKEAIQFIKDYDAVGVEPLSFVPLVIEAHERPVVHTSTLNRAMHTARLVFGDEIPYQEEALFREFERKIIEFPNISLPLKFWLNCSRIVWFLGGNDQNIESFREAKERAKQASERLTESAMKETKVVLVAHGLLNRYLIKKLKKEGWHLVRKGGSDYLAASLLIKLEAQ
jgi:broad specificity phosphatase PhoE